MESSKETNKLKVSGFSLKPKSSSNSPRRSSRFPAAFEKQNDIDPLAKTVVEVFDPSKAPSNEQRLDKDALIIPAVGNKDWRTETLKRRGILVEEDETTASEGEGKGSSNISYGLNIVEKAEANNELDGDKEMDTRPKSSEKIQSNDKPQVQVEKSNEPSEETVRSALLRESNGSSLPYDSGMVIPINGVNALDYDEEEVQPISEAEAYRRDMESRPSAPDFQAYQRVPVEEFGAALLRGMGWNGNLSESNVKTEVKKRAAFLGLGAKPLEIDSKSDKASQKAREMVKNYIPLVRISKRTGEILRDSDSEPPEHEKKARERSYSPHDSRASKRYREREERGGRGVERDHRRIRVKDEDKDRDHDRDSNQDRTGERAPRQDREDSSHRYRKDSVRRYRESDRGSREFSDGRSEFSSYSRSSDRHRSSDDYNRSARSERSYRHKVTN